ncbi:DUF3830 family protein [Bacillus rubiinfantis]|uniref:DUF3830 family protein n=1 Tax=Bacillus rubiinfantis TaxID=1499680 RepID=UPI0005A8ECC7|nr:DUF3830 family protein [Bacillus rubiinfantis]
MKHIRISFERGGELTAMLLEDAAPKTCQMIWKAMPLESVVTHSRWSGREINFVCDDISAPPRENQTIYASAGELCYWRDWQSESIEQQVIAIYYGAELARSHKGNERINVFAQLLQTDILLLKEIGERVWLTGTEKVYIERINNE